MQRPTFYHTARIDGLSIFYREAGPKDAPTLLLLHGFPSSSRMYEPLLARLSDRYRLIAPYRRDVPEAEVHVLDAGHFGLDAAADPIAAPILSFMDRMS